MMPWCLTENNSIHTSNGWLNIKELKEKDFVYNKNFETKNIKKIGERKLLDGESIISIKSFSCPELIEVTDKHNLYTVKNDNIMKKESSTIKIGDYLFVPKPTLFSKDFSISMLDYSIDNKWVEKEGRLTYVRDVEKSNGIYSNVKLSDDLFYLIGLYLAEGCVYSSNDCVSFSFHIDEFDTLFKRCKECIMSVFGLSSDHFYERIYKDRDGCELIINSTLIGRFFRNEFGTKAGNKNIPIRWRLNSSVEYRESLLKGYWDGDGHISYRHSSTNPECVSTTKSLNLSMCLRDILLSFDIVPSMTKNIRSDGRVSYITSVCNKLFDKILLINNANRIESNFYNYKVDNGFAVRVSGVNNSCDYSGIIYSVSVEPGINEDKNGSYILNGVASSNSPWYSGDQLWAEPDSFNGIELMRSVYNNREEAAKKGATLKKDIEDNFSWEEIGNKIINELKKI
jgi:hypothetical protein